MSKINAKSELLRKIASGKVPMGTFVSSSDPSSATILGSAGFDFLIVDCEHAPLDKVHALQHVRAAEAVGAITFARVLENSGPLIQSFLDVGIQGLIVPKVQTAEDARRMVKAVRYSAGGRGMCPICHATGYSMEGWSNHVQCSNDNIVALPTLETRAGVENVEEIVAVDGVDIVLFGPGDLSLDMGLQFGDRDGLMDAWLRVRDAAHAVSKLVMVPLGFGFEGADIVINGGDLQFLRQIATSMAARSPEFMKSYG